MEVTFLLILPNSIALFWGVSARLQAELIKYFDNTVKLRLRITPFNNVSNERINRNKEMKRDPLKQI